jgi:hypothetical protein
VSSAESLGVDLDLRALRSQPPHIGLRVWRDALRVARLVDDDVAL